MPRARHYKKTYRDKKNPSAPRFLFKLGFFASAGVAALGIGIFVFYAKDLPRPENLQEVSFQLATKIYDRTGEVLLYEVHGEEKREFVALERVSPFVPQAIMAIEDQSFRTHAGVDPRGVLRAVLRNLALFSPQQGGSTITQQLARTTLLTREKTLGRKVKELVLTLELERRYSKDEIMEFYINQVPLGGNSYGVGAAALAYFDKPASELSLEESATLAAMIQAPTTYSPFGSHTDILFARKDLVLDNMADTGFITKEEAEEAKAAELSFAEPGTTIRAPHFVLSVLDSLLVRYGEEFLRENGLKVITTLNWDVQQAAEQAVDEVAPWNVAFNAHNAALVAVEPDTGEILAMVGSKDWEAKEGYPRGCTAGADCLFDPKLNVTTWSQGRQPGSAFKPFVYATAFEKGADDETVVVDEETNFGVWSGEEYIPQNYDETFRGEVTLREALALSLNIPSIKVLMEYAGLEDSIARAKEMGITTLRDPSNYGPSLVLGGGEARPLDMAIAYSVFANEGRRVYPSSVLRVEDERGRVIQQNRNGSIQIMEPDVARLVTDILSDNEARAPLFGPASSLYVPGYEAAAKTGSTQEFRDAWTVGYTRNIAAAVWVGNNNNEPMRIAPGATVAAPIWGRFMRAALPLLTP